MKPLPLLVVSSAFAGVFAFVGSVLGNAFGKQALFVGAGLGGIIGVAICVMLVAKLRWLPVPDRLGAFIGGALGFAAAVPIAVTNLDGPIIPVLSCGLIGVGLLLGVGFARGWRGA